MDKKNVVNKLSKNFIFSFHSVTFLWNQRYSFAKCFKDYLIISLPQRLTKNKSIKKVLFSSFLGGTIYWKSQGLH